MLQAETYALMGMASMMKSDFEGVTENFSKAVELALKADPKSAKLGDWYKFKCVGLNASGKNKELLKTTALELISYAKERQDYKNLKAGYEFVSNAMYWTPDYDKEEYQKYKDLEEEAGKKLAEEESLSNPMINSVKAKMVLISFDPDAKITKSFTELDLQEALKVEGIKMISDPTFSRNMESFAHNIINSLEVIMVKSPNTAAEGKAWGGLAFYTCMIGSYLGRDSAMGDLGAKFFERGRVILEKVDRLGNDLVLLLGYGTGMLGQYPAHKELKEKYEKMQKDINDENLRLAREKEKQMKMKLANLEEAKDDMNMRLNKVEVEQKELGDKFQKLQSNVNMVQEKMSQTTEQLKELAQQKENLENMELLNSLLEKEKVLLKRKATMKKIGENQDLSDYYNSLMQDLEAIYIGARAAASGKLEVSKSSSYSDAAEFASGFIDMIPIMGGVFNTVISGVASVADAYTNSKDTVGLANIGDVAPNIVIFDEFIEEVVVAYVKKNEAEVLQLQGEKINNTDWKELIKTAVAGGVEGFFEKVLSENDSKAKLRGKADSGNIIEYLQKGYIKIKPGDTYDLYVKWVIEEIDFNNEEQKVTANEGRGQCCTCNLI